MTSTDRRIAGALALVLCANIAFVLVCELRCDVPVPAAAACHGSVSTAVTSASPVTVADGAHDRCKHDALPAGTIAAIKQGVRVIVQALTGSTQIAGLAPALPSVVSIRPSASLRDDHPTRTVLRI